MVSLLPPQNARHPLAAVPPGAAPISHPSANVASSPAAGANRTLPPAANAAAALRSTQL